MAKAAKTAIKTKDQKAASEAKNWSKVIRSVAALKQVPILLKKLLCIKTKSKIFLLRNNKLIYLLVKAVQH